MKIERCVSIFWSLKKFVFEIYIKFACWWWFCCRSAKRFHIALCVWICNSELRHVRIFVTPCSFHVLLQCDGKARCFFGIKMPVGLQKKPKTRTVQITLADLVGPRSNVVRHTGLLFDLSSRPYCGTDIKLWEDAPGILKCCYQLNN